MFRASRLVSLEVCTRMSGVYFTLRLPPGNARWKNEENKFTEFWSPGWEIQWKLQNHCKCARWSMCMSWSLGGQSGHLKGQKVNPCHWIYIWTHLYLIRRWICTVDWVSRLFPDWLTTWLTVHVTDFFESSRDYNFYSKWVPLNINSICYILYTKWRVLIYTI